MKSIFLLIALTFISTACKSPSSVAYAENLNALSEEDLAAQIQKDLGNFHNAKNETEMNAKVQAITEGIKLLSQKFPTSSHLPKLLELAKAESKIIEERKPTGSFASEVDALLKRKNVSKKQIEKVWTKHQCSRFGSFKIYQKVDDNVYEIGDIYFPSLTHFTGNALLIAKTTTWTSTGRTGPLTTRLLGNESVKLKNGFSKEVMKFEESAECNALYKRLE